MILPRIKQRRSRRLAWALHVVIGKYQVVEDLKDSDEGEKVPRFFCVYVFLARGIGGDARKAIIE